MQGQRVLRWLGTSLDRLDNTGILSGMKSCRDGGMQTLIQRNIRENIYLLNDCQRVDTLCQAMGGSEHIPSESRRLLDSFLQDTLHLLSNRQLLTSLEYLGHQEPTEKFSLKEAFLLHLFRDDPRLWQQTVLYRYRIPDFSSDLYANLKRQVSLLFLSDQRQKYISHRKNRHLTVSDYTRLLGIYHQDMKRDAHLTDLLLSSLISCFDQNIPTTGEEHLDLLLQLDAEPVGREEEVSLLRQVCLNYVYLHLFDYSFYQLLSLRLSPSASSNPAFVRMLTQYLDSQLNKHIVSTPDSQEQLQIFQYCVVTKQMNNIRLVLYQQNNKTQGLEFYLSVIQWMSSLGQTVDSNDIVDISLVIKENMTQYLQAHLQKGTGFSSLTTLFSFVKYLQRETGPLVDRLLKEAFEVEQERISAQELESMLQVVQQRKGEQADRLCHFLLTYLSNEVYSLEEGERTRVEEQVKRLVGSGRLSAEEVEMARLI